MASYKTHTVFNLVVTLPIALYFAHKYFHPSQAVFAIFTGCYIYSTLFMNPDLDLAGQIKLRSLRGLLSIPFRLYAKVFSHRGISHWPVIGSLTRILWVGVPVLIFYFFTHSRVGALEIWSQHKEAILAGFAGIVIADLSHLLLDIKLR